MTNAMPKPIRYELILDSGVRALLAPVSPTLLERIRAEAHKIYTDIDKAPYEKPLPNAAIEGDVIPADYDPDYQKAVAALAATRTAWILRAIRDIAITFPDFESNEAIIAHFQPQIDAAKKLGLLDGEQPLIDWIFDNCIVASQDDRVQIYYILQKNLPISEEEITEQFRLFRPSLSRQALRSLVFAAGQTGRASDISEESK